MAIYGVYDGNSVVTDQQLIKNQRYLLIPVRSDPEHPFGKINLEKKALIDRLAGSIPDPGCTLEESREERIMKI